MNKFERIFYPIAVVVALILWAFMAFSAAPAPPVVITPPPTIEPTQPGETPEPTEDLYPEWTYSVCEGPDLASGEDGFVWAKYVHNESKVLRVATWPGGRDKDWPNTGTNPLMIAAPPGTPDRTIIEPGAEILVYRNPFQGQGDVYVEICSPYAQAIEWKWIRWSADSSTGRGPGDHGIE